MAADVDASEPLDGRQQPVADAVWALLQPLARLAVARGVPFTNIEELLKRAFVEAARQAQPDPTAERVVSRVSAATGINRREVTRLLKHVPRPSARGRSYAAEVFAHWTTAPQFRDRRGAPRVLPRTGEGVSFEALAQTITRDVHPRSLLEDLVRLGLAEHDVERDKVRLLRDTFVPRRDEMRMLGFLADNVGDHLNAAVHNVLAGDAPRHFEQAVFAHELSPASVTQARSAVRKQWQALIEAMVPMLEQLIEADAQAGRTADQRLRIGLFSFSETQAPAAERDDRPVSKRPRGVRKEKS